jgi:mediator of RNA polymerase II transcription subunit 16, fungi type
MKVAIQWGLPQSDNKLPPGGTPLNPVMKEKHVAVTSWLQSDASESHLDASMAQLTHLEVLPSTLDNAGQGWTPPLVLAVRSHVPAAISPYQEVQSIIDRWEIMNEQPQTVHAAFEQLGSRRNSVSTTPAAVGTRIVHSTQARI